MLITIALYDGFRVGLTVIVIVILHVHVCGMAWLWDIRILFCATVIQPIDRHILCNNVVIHSYHVDGRLKPY